MAIALTARAVRPAGTAAPKPFGLILAGGAARRLGGGVKALRTVGGRTILSRILARLAPQCAGLAISIGGEPDRWSFPPHLVLPDRHPDRPGPLAGVAAGLHHLLRQGETNQLLLTVPGDAPFLPPDLAMRLSDARQSAGAATAFATSGGRSHPATALWPASILQSLDTFLAEGRRSVGALHSLLGAAGADWPTTPVDPFFNVNSPEDLEQAERLAKTFGL